VVCDLSNSAISNDLEDPISCFTPFLNTLYLKVKRVWARMHLKDKSQRLSLSFLFFLQIKLAHYTVLWPTLYFIKSFFHQQCILSRC